LAALCWREWRVVMRASCCAPGASAPKTRGGAAAADLPSWRRCCSP
jgi:hypothetical protein